MRVLIVDAGRLEEARSEENQWPLPLAEEEACFRAMIKRCFNAASAGSCVSPHSHHRLSSHNWMASANGLEGLAGDDMLL